MSTGEQAYEPRWAALKAQIDRLIGGGETNLARVVNQVAAAWRAENKGLGAVHGQPVALPPHMLIGGRQALRIGALLSACRPDTGLVVELGSGWGQNLFDLYLNGGPATAAYRALELTQAGRACTEALAGLEPRLDLQTGVLDLLRPDYAALPRGHSHVVVCSLHAIEQARRLPEQAITGLFGLGDHITGVHFEPIGWQMGEERPVGATEAYALSKGYNENLWALLNDLQDRGELTITSAQQDLVGHKRANASSLVTWTRDRRTPG